MNCVSTPILLVFKIAKHIATKMSRMLFGGKALTFNLCDLQSRSGVGDHNVFSIHSFNEVKAGFIIFTVWFKSLRLIR